jgi:hypothetical protein
VSWYFLAVQRAFRWKFGRREHLEWSYSHYCHLVGKVETSVGGKWLPHRPSVVGVSCNLRDTLRRFNALSDDNLDVVFLLRRRSEGGMNNFVTEDTSVIKERVARGSKVLPKKLSTECV